MVGVDLAALDLVKMFDQLVILILLVDFNDGEHLALIMLATQAHFLFNGGAVVHIV